MTWVASGCSSESVLRPYRLQASDCNSQQQPEGFLEVPEPDTAVCIPHKVHAHEL